MALPNRQRPVAAPSLLQVLKSRGLKARVPALEPGSSDIWGHLQEEEGRCTEEAMDAVQLSQLLTRYDIALSIYPNNGPKRHPELESLPKVVEHLRWMINETRQLAANGRPDKALRWLGFIEGTLVQLGIFSLREVQMLDVEISLKV